MVDHVQKILARRGIVLGDMSTRKSPPPPCNKWPLAGVRLNDTIRQQWGIEESDVSGQYRVKDRPERYVLTQGYLIPYYDFRTDEFGEHDIVQRSEELLVDRGRSFAQNAQPQISVKRTKKQIDDAIALYESLPETNHEECAAKAAQFKVITGAIMARLENLGRIIKQRQTRVGGIEYTGDGASGALDDEHIKALKEEFIHYYEYLTHSSKIPVLRTVLHTDMKVDHDGFLIDLIREIGKPVAMEKDRHEPSVREAIVRKIGHAIDSIDTIHMELVRAMTSQDTRGIFENSIQHYIKTNGNRYGITSLEDVIYKLDEFAAWARTRACVRSEDGESYDELFRQYSVLNGFFNGAAGLLQSMRRYGREGSEKDVQELRSLLTRGLKLMIRTAYTRVPCNKYAPEIWVPNFDEDASPMDQFLVNQLLSPKDRYYAQRVYDDGMQRAKELEARDGMKPEEAKQAITVSYLQKQFCSLALFQHDMHAFRDYMRQKQMSGHAQG